MFSRSQNQKHKPRFALIRSCALFLLLAACASTTPTAPTQVVPSPDTAPPSADLPDASATATLMETLSTPIPTPTPLPADFWKSLPVIPDQISEKVREIYQSGLSMGNNPRIFSRIGDCLSAAPDFLVSFDYDYNLGEYTTLQPTIDYFQGAFERPSLAAKAGLNTAGLLTTLWTGDECLKNESLLDCQFRLDHPSFAFISVGSNEAYYIHQNPGYFEINMRLVIEDTISQGIIPILSTKADNLEGDGSVNATIARLALEFELPLWNFWLATEPLENHGMVDSAHLSTVSYAHFTDFTLPNSMKYGMQVRNLNALQMLDLMRRELGEETAGTPTP